MKVRPGRSSSALLAMVAAAGLHAQGPPAAPSGNVLHIDASVVDRSGKPVDDVRPQEFEVWISGYRIPIESVRFVSPSTGGTGRSIVVILDDIAVPIILQSRVQEAARHLVAKMTPGDRMAIVRFDGGAMKLTDDQAALRRAIDDYHIRNVPIRIDDAGRQVLETVTTFSRQLIEVAGRKTIVAIGAGWLFDRPIPAAVGVADLRREWIAAMRAAASSNVAFYVVDPAGLGGAIRADSGTSGFARETGGLAFINTNDLEAAARSIMNEAATYYVLSVKDPPVGRTVELRDVDVKVLRRGLTVRARRGISPPR